MAAPTETWMDLSMQSLAGHTVMFASNALQNVRMRVTNGLGKLVI
jgi:hypothetical protein